MQKLINVKRGDIIWLDPNMPYTMLGDNVQDLERPYMVISNDLNNENCPTINIVSISKQVKKSKYPMHVFLDKKKYKGLRHNSVILVEQIKTVNKCYVKEVVGTLDYKDMKKLNKATYIQFIDYKLNKKAI